MKPLISIITVCFNESRQKIALTFDNICSQTYENTEWIVVDGGSNLDTIDGINQYSAKIDKFISEPDKGVYDAMNKGIALASGEFLIFMNVGDTFYQSDTIASVVDSMIATPGYDCYYGDAIIIDESGREWALPQIRRVNRYNLHHSMVCHQTTFSRRTLYDSIGDFDLDYRIIADKDWALRSVDAGAKWLFIDGFICHYDCNGISADVTKRDLEIEKFVSQNYRPLEKSICFVLRKYRNLKQRLQRIFKCSYNGLPYYLAK